MTTITTKTENTLKCLRVNGRLVNCNPRIDWIKKENAGKWVGEANGEPFVIIGGKASGGASNEWLTQWGPAAGDIYMNANSAMAAVKLIENC